MNIISRKEASELGLKRYFTGKPCKHGHIAERRVSARHCCECTKGKRGGYADGEKAYKHKYYMKNREKQLKKAKERYESDKRPFFERAKKWRKLNPARVNGFTAARRADMDFRTPPWADLEAIKFFYECAPKGCHVDHIIPLRGSVVSGFHVETNLQWLPAKENMRKSNSWT